jgi:hypothetical protein
MWVRELDVGSFCEALRGFVDRFAGVRIFEIDWRLPGRRAVVADAGMTGFVRGLGVAL